MAGLLAGEVIISPRVLLVLLLFVAAGYAAVHFVVNRKWGYTEKREKELEEADFSEKNRK